MNLSALLPRVSRSLCQLAGALISHAVLAEPCHDEFSGTELSSVWRQSTVLSHGRGATPVFSVAEERLLWSYASGTRNAQQQVLLRDDTLPQIGECVQVTVFADDFPPPSDDFAGLALSTVGDTATDRTGLLLLYLDKHAASVRVWHFGGDTHGATVAHQTSAQLREGQSVVLRLARTSEAELEPSWSTDGTNFHFLPRVRATPIRGVGVYAGNARMPKGNAMAFDDFHVMPAPVRVKPIEEKPTTPSWTSPDDFLLAAEQERNLGWPVVAPEARPGAYWWWPASAVDRESITWNMEICRRAGFGNLGVVGIYGVKGEEHRAIELFTPKWFEVFNHALGEGHRLGMNVDLTPSGGWRLGGPHVPERHSEMRFAVEGDTIRDKSVPSRVKRAGPGGTGLAINPYSISAVMFHLDHIDRLFTAGKGTYPRAFYYDSFENTGNWCPEFLDAFHDLRGYDLTEYAAELGGKGDPDTCRRVLCDYRETLSDLLIDCVSTIVRWGESHGSLLRMQAHGAPANLLDMYAAAGIPETEVFGATTFDIPGFRRDAAKVRADRQSDLVNRFASSAAHVAGHPLVVSESFTWLRNHYNVALSHIKAEADNLLLNGVNCIYYHGICYSPKSAAWPGWLFYASTQANPRNSIFRDMLALNTYIARCQSVLQDGKPDSDLLVYWPVFDLWSGGGRPDLRFAVHHPEWIENSPCGEAGQWLVNHGVPFDFVSDRQLRTVRFGQGRLEVGGLACRAVLVPAATRMTLQTFERLMALAAEGATVLVWQRLPSDVPGLRSHETRCEHLRVLTDQLQFDAAGIAQVGKGRFVLRDDLNALLRAGPIVPEPMVSHGLKFIRRRYADGKRYLVANHSAQPVDGWVDIASPAASVVLMDPMTGAAGATPTRAADDLTQVYLQMQPGDTRILCALQVDEPNVRQWPIWRDAARPVTVDGEWHVEFVEGGPSLPEGFRTRELRSWTELGDDQARRFAGAARYTITFTLPPGEARDWLLNLGDVRESARVRVNDSAAGILIAHPFRLGIGRFLKPGLNTLSIEVTNLSANRIRDLDIKGVQWKKFHDINLVNHLYRPFDASGWDLAPSGLLGPITLTPLEAVPAPR